MICSLVCQQINEVVVVIVAFARIFHLDSNRMRSLFTIPFYRCWNWHRLCIILNHDLAVKCAKGFSNVDFCAFTGNGLTCLCAV